MIFYKYNEIKATQAAGVLLKNAGGSMDYYLLTKILYITERESLKRWNRVMFGGNLASMPYGPVHSSILDSAKYSNTTTKYWMENISESDPNNQISLKISNIDDDELSEREIALLSSLYEEYKDFNFDDMMNLTHTFPEYENPGRSSLPIEIESILQAFAKTREEIEFIECNAELMRTISRVSC